MILDGYPVSSRQRQSTRPFPDDPLAQVTQQQPALRSSYAVDIALGADHVSGSCRRRTSWYFSRSGLQCAGGTHMPGHRGPLTARCSAKRFCPMHVRCARRARNGLASPHARPWHLHGRIGGSHTSCTSLFPRQNCACLRSLRQRTVDGPSCNSSVPNRPRIWAWLHTAGLVYGGNGWLRRRFRN